MDDRSSWDSLVSQIIPLVRQMAQSNGQQQKLTVVAESFGGCLAFRLALAVPELIANMVVVNSATCFNKSYSGIINLIAASNLLSLFPEQLYQVFPVARGMRLGHTQLGCSSSTSCFFVFETEHHHQCMPAMQVWFSQATLTSHAWCLQAHLCTTCMLHTHSLLWAVKILNPDCCANNTRQVCACWQIMCSTTHACWAVQVKE